MSFIELLLDSDFKVSLLASYQVYFLLFNQEISLMEARRAGISLDVAWKHFTQGKVRE